MFGSGVKKIDHSNKEETNYQSPETEVVNFELVIFNFIVKNLKYKKKNSSFIHVYLH